MKEKIYPSEKAERFILRMPDGLRDRIKKAAERNYRSMNSEVVMQLERLYGAENEKAEALPTA